jgi:hypothetical protein
MNAELLNIFFSEDGDAHVRQKLIDAIQKQRTSGLPLMQELNFNRINVTLDFEAKVVSFQDDLTVGPEGEYKLDLNEFKKVLHERR